MMDGMVSPEALRDTPVNRVIRTFPQTVEVFARHRIDSCCGGAAAVGDAALRDGADPGVLVAELLAAVQGG